MLDKGQKAPDFSLPDQNGNFHGLSDFADRIVVLYFYSHDNTAGCTREARAFKSAFDGFRSKDIVVIGISKDGQASHQKFIEKYDLPFLLLSDTELTAIKAYDVWKEKKMYGKTSFSVLRTTYIINEKGYIEKVYRKVNPDTNAAEILEYLSGLSANPA